MSQSDLIQGAYKKNNRGFARLSRGDHSLEVNLTEWDIDQSHVTFESNDYPYFRLALLDKWLEDNGETNQP